MVPIKSPRSPNAFKMCWTLSQELKDLLVPLEMFSDMDQVLIQDGIILRIGIL